MAGERAALHSSGSDWLMVAGASPAVWHGAIYLHHHIRAPINLRPRFLWFARWEIGPDVMAPFKGRCYVFIRQYQSLISLGLLGSGTSAHGYEGSLLYAQLPAQSLLSRNAASSAHRLTILGGRDM